MGGRRRGRRDERPFREIARQLLHDAGGKGLWARGLGNAFGGAGEEEPKKRAAGEELGRFSVQGIVLGLARSGAIRQSTPQKRQP